MRANSKKPSQLLLATDKRILVIQQLVTFILLYLFSSLTLANENIVTGRSSSDTVSYWNCSLLDSETTAAKGTNHHIRFWANGLGRSGQTNFVWSTNGEDKISLLISGKQVVLKDVKVTELSDTNTSEVTTMLSMTDSSGDFFNCQLIGGIFGAPDQNAFFLQDDSLSLLEYHLSGDGNNFWTCETNPATKFLHGSQINFKKNGDVIINDALGNWYVDNLYFLNITINSNVHVVADIEFADGLNKFNGLFQDSPVACAKTN